VLTIAAMFAIGLWVSAIARTAGWAGAIGQLLFYPLLFFAGLWLPRERMASVLRDISDWTPMGAAVRSLHSSMLGTFPSAQSLLVLAAWAVVFGVLAVRFFRWE
jgi:ABC-2 type transport system permease protein